MHRNEGYGATVGGEMIANVPYLQPSQPIESAIALSWLMNGGGTLTRLFIDAVGRGKTIKPFFTLPTQTGFGRVARHLGLSNCSSPDALVDQHSYLPLFRPFLGSCRYDAGRQRLMLATSDRLSQYGEIWKSLELRGTRYYCVECARGDFSALGYAFARREHQVVGVLCCAQHQAALRPCRDTSTAQPGHWGILLSLKDIVDGSCPDLGVASSPLKQRFAAFVAAALRGELPQLDPAQRRSAFRDRLNAMGVEGVADPGSPRAMEVIVRRFNEEGWLSSLGLPTRQGRSQRWPALFMAGVAYQECPAANLVLLATLFEEPSEYSAATGELAEADPDAVAGAKKGQAIGHPARPFDGRLMRALMGDSTLTISKEIGCDRASIRAILDNYPGLWAARRHYRQLARLRASRRALASFVQEAGHGARRGELLSRLTTDFVRVADADPDYLDSLVPRRRSESESKVEVCGTDAEILAAFERASITCAQQDPCARLSPERIRRHVPAEVLLEVRRRRIPGYRVLMDRICENNVKHRERLCRMARVAAEEARYLDAWKVANYLVQVPTTTAKDWQKVRQAMARCNEWTGRDLELIWSGRERVNSDSS